MHFELPKTPLKNFRDFAKDYLMIVLSILTALGLEAWIQHVNHAQAAASASRQIEIELRESLDDLHEATRVNQIRLVQLQQLDDSITKDIQSGLSNAVINQHIQAERKQFQLSMNWPGFNSEAWDVAVANQSATWIDPARLRKYSQAYASERSSGDWMTHQATIALNGPRMEDVQTELKLGVAVDPVEFATLLGQMVNVMKETQSHLAQTEGPLRAALPESAAKATVTN
jgi:hypothetical protein